MCAAQGHVESWFHLGLMHLNGWGTRKAPQQALYFFTLAARMGHALAQYNLAMLHLQGGAADRCAARKVSIVLLGIRVLYLSCTTFRNFEF